MVKVNAGSSSGKQSKGAVLFEEFGSSASERGLDGLDFYIAGNPGVGKTHLAATLSKQFPSDPVWPLKESIWLEDTFWLAADNEAKIGLLEKGLDCDDIDLHSMLAKHSSMVSCLSKSTDIIRYMVAEKGKKVIVIDTMTKLADELATHYSEQEWKDPRHKWDAVRAQLVRFKRNMNLLPCHVVFLMHLKAANTSDEQMAGREATRLPGMAGKEIAVVGSASNMMRNDASLIGNLTVKYRKKEIIERKLCFNIEQDIEAKLRLSESLKGWTDCHLGHVMDHLNEVIQPVEKPDAS